MKDLDLAFTKKIDTRKLTQLDKIKNKYQELFLLGSPPEEHLLELSPFMDSKPQKLYNEKVYENVLNFLTNYYSKHQNDLVSHFTHVAENWRKGALSTAYFSRTIEQTNTDHLKLEEKVLSYWSVWYLNLVEGCLKPVSNILVWARLQANGSTIKSLEQEMPDMSTRAVHLNKEQSLSLICKDYDTTARNGTAHSGITFLKDDNIKFSDKRGNSVVWSQYEFKTHIEGLLDV